MSQCRCGSRGKAVRPAEPPEIPIAGRGSMPQPAGPSVRHTRSHRWSRWTWHILEAVPFDFPEVQQARRDALAWWIDLLGDSLVCVTTLAADPVHYIERYRGAAWPGGTFA